MSVSKRARAYSSFMAEDYSTIKVYRHLTTFIPGRSWAAAKSGIIPRRNRYGPDEGCAPARRILSTEYKTTMSDFIEKNSNNDGIDRRGFLNAWPGPAPES